MLNQLPRRNKNLNMVMKINITRETIKRGVLFPNNAEKLLTFSNYV